MNVQSRKIYAERIANVLIPMVATNACVRMAMKWMGKFAKVCTVY